MLQARWLKAASVVLVWGAIGTCATVLAQQETPDAGSRIKGIVKTSAADDVPVQLVKPGKLSVTVTAKGAVETSEGNQDRRVLGDPATTSLERKALARDTHG
jgi:multidrug efflux pump subunit AcrA (membrane-fusion protein)